MGGHLLVATGDDRARGLAPTWALSKEEDTNQFTVCQQVMSFRLLNLGIIQASF